MHCLHWLLLSQIIFQLQAAPLLIDSDESDDQSGSDTGIDANNSAELTLQRTLQLIRDRQGSSGSSMHLRQRQIPYDKAAQQIISNQQLSSSSASSSQGDQTDSQRPSTSQNVTIDEPDDYVDLDYCPEEIVLSRWRVTPETMRYIIKLHEQGRKETSIKKQSEKLS